MKRSPRGQSRRRNPRKFYTTRQQINELQALHVDIPDTWLLTTRILTTDRIRQLPAPIEIHWIPAHKRVLGNERADHEAKTAAKLMAKRQKKQLRQRIKPENTQTRGGNLVSRIGNSQTWKGTTPSSPADKQGEFGQIQIPHKDACLHSFPDADG